MDPYYWRIYLYVLVTVLFVYLIPRLLRSVFRYLYCPRRDVTGKYYGIAAWSGIINAQRQEFVKQGVFKPLKYCLVKSRRLIVCKSFLVLKKSGRSRLISLPKPFDATLRHPQGLMDFLIRLRDQASHAYRPSLPSVKAAFNALADFRSRFPPSQKDVMREAKAYSNMRFSREVVFLELTCFLKNHVIEFGGRFLKQIKGIPQGSMLSSDLCNLFLAHVDRLSPLSDLFRDGRPLSARQPNKENQPPEAAIFRFLDDYLYIATSKEGLLEVRRDLIRNLKKYGLNSNKSKEDGGMESEPAYVKWLGLEITPNLDLLVPTVLWDARVFNRFGNHALPWNACLRRLNHCLRASFHITPVINQLAFKTDPVLAQENARRIGEYCARLVYEYVWSSPERQEGLASPSHCRQLAKILLVRNGCCFADMPLFAICRDALIQRLQMRRCQFRLLLRFLYRPWLVLLVVGKGTRAETVIKNISTYLQTREFNPIQ